jgi:uncharacterized protein with PQ loop repeat
MDSFAYVGGGILSIQMIPQIHKIVTSKSAQDLSFSFMGMNVLGLMFMLIYAINNSDRPLYITISLSIFNTCVSIFLKYYYDYYRIKDDDIKSTEISAI